jgi:hypothetical protein
MLQWCMYVGLSHLPSDGSAFVRTGDSYTPALVLESRVAVFTWCQLYVLQIKLFRFCGQISSISSSEIAKLTCTLRTL